MEENKLLLWQLMYMCGRRRPIHLFGLSLSSRIVHEIKTHKANIKEHQINLRQHQNKFNLLPDYFTSLESSAYFSQEFARKIFATITICVEIFSHKLDDE